MLTVTVDIVPLYGFGEKAKAMSTTIDNNDQMIFADVPRDMDIAFLVRGAWIRWPAQ